MDLEWIVNRLINNEYAEDMPELSKDDYEKLLRLISSKTGKTHMLIINVNIDSDNTTYDYVLDNNDINKVLINEWDNRYL